jgi:hypothetical protein
MAEEDIGNSGLQIQEPSGRSHDPSTENGNKIDLSGLNITCVSRALTQVNLVSPVMNRFSLHGLPV